MLLDKVSVFDGVLRGLAQNHSERLWARDVVVTATDASGAEGVWRFALAVQPGEAMPFEIEGWTGSDDVSEISFEVSADLSPTIDLSRSLRLSWARHYITEEDWWLPMAEEFIAGSVPEGDFSFIEVSIEREESTPHPRLAEAALGQTVENLTVYGAHLDIETQTVLDVFEMTPTGYDYTPGAGRRFEIREIPVALSEGHFIEAATVGAIPPHYNPPLVWAGGALPTAPQPDEAPQ